ncbi:RDD family protein [Streptomyces peucetius]|uniref:RDD family protein n=1 Tax=Streptomyces peucetius TaxID=1950 RepID=A0ABY6I5S6_STRPE|nr:RDD family protein [Streptomyces peucetius]UYQ62351.1 RDD family protein [Streptomyces peucetius]
MSNDQPPTGPPPDEDPLRKRPQEPKEPGGPTPPPGNGPAAGGSSPYDSPYGGTGGAYGAGGGGQPPGYDAGAYGGPYGGADPLAGMPPLAPFGKRVLARLIDMIIVFVPLVLISLFFGGIEGTYGGDDWDEVADRVNSGEQWLWSLITLVAYIGYDTIMTAKNNGQTLGKKIMKLRTAMLNDGRVPDVGSSFLRAAVLWVPALVCCYCIWWIVIVITVLTDKPYRQGLHDKAGKTVVVSAAQ